MCVICGVEGGVVDGHREDYTPPFRLEDDIPACYRCHMMIHCRFSFPDAWERYRAEIRAGWRYEPLLTRDFGAFVAQTVRRSATVVTAQGQNPERLWLDEIHAGKLCPKGRQPGNSSTSTMGRSDALVPLGRSSSERLRSIRQHLDEIMALRQPDAGHPL